MAKRFRFNLGWRKTAPLVVEGEDWSRPDLAILQEVKWKGIKKSGGEEKGSFNGFRKKETAGRSSGREKGENKI